MCVSYFRCLSNTVQTASIFAQAPSLTRYSKKEKGQKKVDFIF